MAKYDEQFKLRIVRLYLNGPAGAKVIGRKHGLGHSTIERWVARYREHGRTGLRRKGASYDAAFKLEVLERMRSELWSQSHAAAVFNIRSAAHIGKWARQYDRGGINALVPHRGRTKFMTKKPSTAVIIEEPTERDDTRTIAQLRKQNEYLLAENAYLKKLDALIQQKRAAAQKKRGS